MNAKKVIKGIAKTTGKYTPNENEQIAIRSKFTGAFFLT